MRRTGNRAAADGHDSQGAAGSRLPFKSATDKSARQASRLRPAPGRVPLLASDLSGTTWKLPTTSRTSIDGVGEETGQGTLRVTFRDDGGLIVEDDSGITLDGAWAVDEEGELSAQVFPQSVEDYLRAALGAGPGESIDIDSADLMLELDGDGLSVALDIAATLGWLDPDTNRPATRGLEYQVTAAESGEPAASDTPGSGP